MYVVGGTMNGREYTCSQMCRLDLQTLQWDQVGTRGTKDGDMPACIDEHSAVLDGTQVIIFGGFVDGERVNHVHTLDLETHKWSKIEPADPNAAVPTPRAGHTGSLHEHNLYVFGGKDDENNKL